MKIKELIFGAALGLCVGCSGGPTDELYNPTTDANSIQWPQGKAEDFSTYLKPGQTLQGNVSGSSVALYRILLKDTEQPRETPSKIRVQIRRTDGTLEPQAFLFKDLGSVYPGDAYLPPLPDYTYGNGKVDLGWELYEGGNYFLVVKAYAAKTAGSYDVSLTCEGDLCNPFQVEKPTTLELWMKAARQMQPHDWANDLESQVLECSNKTGDKGCGMIEKALSSIIGFPGREDAEKYYFKAMANEKIIGYAGAMVSYTNCPANADGSDLCEENTAMVFITLDGKILFQGMN